MKILTALLAIIALTSVSSARPKQIKIKLRKDPDVVKKQVEKLIPVGTDISAAGRIMEANKFLCQPARNASFTIGTEEKPGKEYKNIDYLYCQRHKSTLAGFLDPRRLFYMREWNIAFVQKNGLVTDILVNVGWFSDL